MIQIGYCQCDEKTKWYIWTTNWPVIKVDSFDVTNDPLVAVTNLEKFLNLDPEISEKNFIYNSTKVRILFRWKIILPYLCQKCKNNNRKIIKSNIL